jgi:hypothetical protein
MTTSFQSLRWLVSGVGCVPAVLLVATLLQAAEDGKRAVDVPRFGVHVRVPQAWDLVDWSRDDTAFVLDVPQDDNSPVGHAACTIGAAPESLEAYRDRFAKNEPPPTMQVPGADTLKPTKWTVVRNEISEVPRREDSEKPTVRFERRLTVEWELEDKAMRRWFERRIYAVGQGLLYTFSLDSDEAHYDAYALDFEEMFAGAKILPVELGVSKGTEGYWIQREFRFGLRLPETWRPAPGPNDRILFYAVGDAHGVFTDDLEVRASPPQPLDLQRLLAEMPNDVKRLDAAAEASCRLVPQGQGKAIETLIRTKRGSVNVTILERRFSTKTRNYEIRFSCESKEFERRQAELRAVLDGFVELGAEAKPSET